MLMAWGQQILQMYLPMNIMGEIIKNGLFMEKMVVDLL